MCHHCEPAQRCSHLLTSWCKSCWQPWNMERVEGALPWTQPLQEVHAMDEQRPWRLHFHERHQAFPPLICSPNLGENVLPFLHWRRWRWLIKPHTASQSKQAVLARLNPWSSNCSCCYFSLHSQLQGPSAKHSWRLQRRNKEMTGKEISWNQRPEGDM